MKSIKGHQTSDIHILTGLERTMHRREVPTIVLQGSGRRLRTRIDTDDVMRLIIIMRESGLPARIGLEVTGNSHRMLMYC